ncbi:hypothetical protein C8R48DRAFT_772008 [Suillus tomentosus]|nr:hypothetical protein C8R48DRAFT_772008 [Suillus tomentosus]
MTHERVLVIHAPNWFGAGQRPDHLRLNEPQNQTAKGDVVDIVDGPYMQAHVELATAPVLGCSPDVHAFMLDLDLPTLPTMIQQFLHDQLHIGDDKPPKFDPAMAPAYMGRVSVFSSAAASFYAPSDLSGTGGMRHEHIQAMPSWRGGPARNDCVFVSMNDEVNCGLDGLAVVRVLHFLGFHRDPDTGMYLIAPSTNDDGTPDVSIIHIDCIFRAAHLIPLYGTNFLPRTITLHNSYNIFCAFYVNKMYSGALPTLTLMKPPCSIITRLSTAFFDPVMRSIHYASSRRPIPQTPNRQDEDTIDLKMIVTLHSNDAFGFDSSAPTIPSLSSIPPVGPLPLPHLPPPVLDPLPLSTGTFAPAHNAPSSILVLRLPSIVRSSVFKHQSTNNAMSRRTYRILLRCWCRWVQDLAVV